MIALWTIAIYIALIPFPIISYSCCISRTGDTLLDINENFNVKISGPRGSRLVDYNPASSPAHYIALPHAARPFIALPDFSAHIDYS